MNENWLNKIHQIDAVELLKKLDDNSVDLIATDPPYGFASRNNKPINSVEKQWFAINEGWDTYVPTTYLEEMKRVLKPHGTFCIFSGRNGIYEIAYNIINMGYRILNDVTWYKRNAMPNLTGRMMTETTERFLWGTPHESGWYYDLNYAKSVNYGKNLRDVWDILQKTGSRLHPTQKPLVLMERIISLFSKVGGVIVDPFCGSGTTAVAAKNLGRNFICGDTDPHYVEIARHRIEYGEEATVKKYKKKQDDDSNRLSTDSQSTLFDLI